MPEFLDSLEQADSQRLAAWLTAVLAKNGPLRQGRVIDVQKHPFEERNKGLYASHIYQLELTFSSDAIPQTPSSLFLKTSRPELLPELLQQKKREVDFYTNVTAQLLPDLPLPRCYDAMYSPETLESYLLLEDFTKTHFTHSALPPVLIACERIVDCLAKCHGNLWDHPFLEKATDVFPTEEVITPHFQQLEKFFSCFADFIGDRLSKERLKIFERIFASLPSVLNKRYAEKNHLTVVQGDSHFGQFLYPLDPEKHSVYMIDWECWLVDIGCGDLSKAISLYWYPERRARMETSLLKRYYDQLLEHGVRSYDWDKCVYDYKLTVIRNVLIAMEQWYFKVPSLIWWPHLEISLLNFQDLVCDELLV